MSAHLLAEYLDDCRRRHKTGALTPETSLYQPLEELLTAVGNSLKPRVRCFMNLKNQGAGMPDGGLFTPDQFDKEAVEAPPGQKPARGVIECKKPKDEVSHTVETQQVSDYWEGYHLVLVTNYRDFTLLGMGDDNFPQVVEFYTLADTEKKFWTRPVADLVGEHGDAFLDFLKRCLLHAAPITEPKDVAWFLASYAREAKTRIARIGTVPALDSVQTALEDALGLSFEKSKEEDGRAFFRSTLVQTLFYGIFSAWVLWHRSHPKKTDKFDWETASGYIRVPVLRKLFRELSDPENLKEWKLHEVLEWAAAVLGRVARADFFAKFKDTEAVQYFYEPFLEQFDPALRKQLGVWYTPPEIVTYMVGRVDALLRTELGRPDGLADEGVFVLDPCCGTGAFLVEVLRRIDATLTENGADATRAAKLKKAATDRVFGFELLPAPFVVAHLQLGLYLADAGAPFDDGKERAAVYLTNALTGWDPKVAEKQTLFDELDKERQSAKKVKRKTPILVVLGNPPYNGFPGIAAEEERLLSDSYRATAATPPDLKPQGHGLNDLYTRFFGMAEACILRNETAEGIVCFISNYSWLDGLSFPLMRERYLSGFDAIWIDSLNGDKYRTGKQTPAGDPDPSAFSTEKNREGIQVGTAIATMVRRAAHAPPAVVHYRDFWGRQKLADLVAFGAQWDATAYQPIEPVRALGLPFRQMVTNVAYTTWPTIGDLIPTGLPGVQTKRDEFLTDIDQNSLQTRIETYFDLKVSHEEFAAGNPEATKDTQRYQWRTTREQLQKRGILAENVVRYMYRAFDVRWVYWEPETKLLGEKSPECFRQMFKGNICIEARQKEAIDFWARGTVSTVLPDNFGNGFSTFFPLLLRPAAADLTTGHDDNPKAIGEHVANVSDAGLDYLNTVGGIGRHPDLFFHTVAVLHAPKYAAENADALRQDWPRVPLPNCGDALAASGALGKQLAALLDPESAVPGVTAGRSRPELKVIAVIGKTDGTQLDPNKDCEVNARWGIAGKGGICMPSVGKSVERAYTPAEAAALGDRTAQLGDSTFDIYLNGVTLWANVPAKVWQYTLGGYQVLKKWLSYRESALLGRPLTLDEVEYFQKTARRIAAILLLGPELDANYRLVCDDLYPWPTS